MNDGNGEARITPTDLLIFPVVFLVTLLWSHVRHGDWNVPNAFFAGVVGGGAGILGQLHGRRKR